MRLITHNMLMCNKKGCTTDNFPLKLTATETDKDETEVNVEFLKHILPKLQWDIVVATAKENNMNLPDTLTPDQLDNEEVAQAIHDAIVDWRVVAGSLECQGCERVYPIKSSIPNMILNEDEV
eukprot:GFYU01018142.1.p2 GENE.GFYU01018142.1~~GFYU01018142.1.p2  ORF type:complete len:131 (+),score=32.96 GFYU01018142.1:26-394(+)